MQQVWVFWDILFRKMYEVGMKSKEIGIVVIKEHMDKIAQAFEFPVMVVIEKCGCRTRVNSIPDKDVACKHGNYFIRYL